MMRRLLIVSWCASAKKLYVIYRVEGSTYNRKLNILGAGGARTDCEWRSPLVWLWYCCFGLAIFTYGCFVATSYMKVPSYSSRNPEEPTRTLLGRS